MINAWLVVQSRELTLAEISRSLLKEPDEGYDRGELAPVREVPRGWSSWSMELTWPTEIHGGTQGLSVAIEAIGLALAERAGRLAAQGCEVVLSIRQEVSDTPKDVGLHLTPSAVRWLGVAGAKVSVDQYVDSEPEAT